MLQSKPALTLLDVLSTQDHLIKAWVSLNKYNRKSKGLSGETIDDFASNLQSNIQSISDQLKSGKYQFSKSRAVAIKKKQGGYRPLRIPEIRDRVVLKAIALLIEDILESKYNLNNEASFAYQKKKGVEGAINRMCELYASGKKVILEADIEKFFDSVDNDLLLKRLVFPVLPDNSINDLILNGITQEIGNTEICDEHDWDVILGGIPQGNSLSPLLSNVYLYEFDKIMLENNFGLIRYADDFIVMCETKKEANTAYEIAKDVIENKLKLKLHPLEKGEKTKIVYPNQVEFSFLSIAFNGQEIWPSKTKLISFKEKIREVTGTETNKDVLTILTKTKNLLYGWLACFQFTDVDRYFIEIDNYTNLQLANALRQLEWSFKTKLSDTFKNENNRQNSTMLSKRQRINSGILTCEGFYQKYGRNKFPKIKEWNKVTI